jgi:ribosomal protein S12 methylthiotransferase
MTKERFPILSESAATASSTATSSNTDQDSLDVRKRTVPFAGNVLMSTLGCSKNLVDSEVMLGALVSKGYEVVSDAAFADVIVVNTCAFLQSAVEEGVDQILELSEFKKTGRCKQLVVAGCMVERYREDLVKSLPEVDAFISTDELLKVGDDHDMSSTGAADAIFDKGRRPYFLYDENMPRVRSTGVHSAYVKIAEGCDRPCAFCIIPKIRGAFRSREIQSIVREMSDLLDDGVVEINLVAQDLTAYGTDFEGNRGIKSELPALLRAIDDFEASQDNFWVRLFYAYPIGVSEELIKLIQSSKRVCSYLDLPLQHISHPVLKRMKRPLGEKGTRGLIEQIHSIAPDIALRTTFVVGFPGETEEDVDALVEFVSKGYFTHVGVFTYSQESEAESFNFPDQIDDEVKEARRARVMEAQAEIVAQRLASMLGKRERVLIEGRHVESDLLLAARASWQGPEADGEIIINEFGEDFEDGELDVASLKGAFVDIEYTEVAGYDLVAKIVHKD